MTLRLNLDQKNAGVEFGACENISFIDEQDGKPIYMSSDFAADGSKINNPFYFGSLEFMRDAAAAHVRRAGESISPQFPSVVPMAIAPVWDRLKKIWRLDSVKRYDISAPLKSEFARLYDIPDSNLDDLLYWFIRTIFDNKSTLIPEAKLAIEKKEEEFKRFLHYYSCDLKEHHWRSYFDIFSQFFDAFDQFSQVIIYTRNGIRLPKDAKVTSTNFDKTKKFYASAYEFYAGAIEMLTEINNILSGRAFDKLSAIDLKSFVKTDKAQRRNSLATNTAFTDASKEFDHQIRNASFHNWFYLLGDNTTIEYRSGGTGEAHQLPYIEYVLKCTRLFHQICELLILELFLGHLRREWALVTR
ncbi:hypothetical protein [Paraburkholderia acidipaludis]|uniref:hypothetical protein n=1 Tax=Paraburkholderia acidipaludis TaxID=660537 RepID=UPI0012EB3389|nr:hypothetical protein [Paraburkholderia acidipaludis]